MSKSKPDLEAAREEFASRLESLRDSIGRSSRLRPRRPGWWILLLSGAVGMALAGRKRRRGELEEPG